MKTFTSPTQKIGQIGENIVCRYLCEAGFVIQVRNYARKWGELDIVCVKGGKIHFIEVKSVSCERFEDEKGHKHVHDQYRPEDQVHIRKRKRLVRIIQTYMSERSVGEWQFDIVCVFLNRKTRLARLRFLWDIVIS